MLRATCVMLGLLCTIAPASGQVDQFRPVLPPDVYGVPGHEMNIYFDNVVLVPNIRDCFFDVTCAKGRQDQDRWRFVPTDDDLGDHPLSLKALDAVNNVLAEASTMLHVVPAGGAGQSFSLMCVGDSLTHASVYPHELWNLFGAEPANLRSETEIARQSNGVHPAPAGYRQIADTIYAWLSYRLSQ